MDKTLFRIIMITIAVCSIWTSYELINNSNFLFYTNLQQDFKNIIFVETNASRSKLTFKESCAVESAAKNNPEMQIKLFSLKAEIHNDLLQKYTNIKYILFDLDDFFKKTTLKSWWFSGILSKASYFRESHLSDALRFTLIYKYGGFYSDLDTITVKNLSPLSKYAGVGIFEENNELGSGFMHFPKKHNFLKFIIDRFTKNYKADRWDVNGPRLIENLLFKYCDISNLKELLLNDNDIETENETLSNEIIDFCDVKIYPYKYIYQYHWTRALDLMKHDASYKIKDFQHAFSIHFYGKISEKYELTKNEYSIYEHFASINCPVSYKIFIMK